MIVFLVDADNLSSPDWVNEALEILEASEGALAVRRAYGSADNLKGLAEMLRTWAIRPFVNLSLSKNTTDIALASDAMEFACQTPAPSMIVIGSGDADFVPLVVRLRERGIKVVCVSERSKMASEAVYAYDKVLFVGNQKAGSTDSPMDNAGASVHGRANAANSTTAKSTPVKKVAAKKSPTKKTAAKKVDTKAPAATVDKTSVSVILAAVPNLKAGEWLHLSDAAKALHNSKLLGKNASTTKLFNKYPDQFELTPNKQPNKVRYITPLDKL
ncbi:NYN domain-containing protein [Hydrogenophaga sp.]